MDFDLAARETFFDLMNSLQNDAHVSSSTHLAPTIQFDQSRLASLSRDRLLSSPIATYQTNDLEHGRSSPVTKRLPLKDHSMQLPAFVSASVTGCLYWKVTHDRVE
jgi:hypothetical protein